MTRYSEKIGRQVDLMKTLRQTKVGQDAKVVKLHGDPIEVTVRGYELSLRKADADMIEIE